MKRIIAIFSVLFFFSCKDATYVSTPNIKSNRKFDIRPQTQIGFSLYCSDCLTKFADSTFTVIDTTGIIETDSIGIPSTVVEVETSQIVWHVFDKPVILEGLTFYSSFSNKIFNNNVYFWFNKLLYDSSNSSKYIDYIPVYIRNVTFNAPLDFYNNETSETYLFRDCNFNDTLLVHSDSALNQPFNFSNCIFFKLTQFGKGVQAIKSNIKFENCKFNNKTSFANCMLNEGVDVTFSKSNLPDTIDFSRATLLGTVNLLEAFPNIHNRKCEINLINCDIDRIRLTYDNFHLFFPNKMLDSSKYSDIVSATFESLLNNFKKHGYNISYQTLDIEYKEWLSNTDWTLKLSGLWWKFGYQKSRILIYTFSILLLFSIFNYVWYSELQTVYPVEKLRWNMLSYTPYRTVLFLKKFFAILLYTGLIFFRFSIDYKNVNFKPMKFVAIIIFQYIIGLVCTGFLINWILKG